MAPTSSDVITLGEEVEGDYEGTADFLFFRIGASVPLTPSCSAFDHTDPPRRPLAVSERFGLLFLAHSEGFLAAKTKDVIRLAKDIKEIVEAEKEKREKEKVKHPSIQESSVVDVRIGRVSILALDKDSSTLAAIVGGEIRVYSVPSLLKKDQMLLFSHSLGESGNVRDFSWCEGSSKSFTLLSTHGSLYHRDVNGIFHNVMDNVDAVSWSREGDFIAVARKHTLSILSGTFEELNHTPLVFNTASHVKVDSIKWICPGIIIIGCTQLNDDCMEDGYIVQVISNSHGGFKVSSQPAVTCFSNLFHGIDDLLPSESGAHLLVGYLPRWGLALVANRKNVDDHVVLLELPVSNKRDKPTVLELEQEKFTPRIELQENGDENLVLGLDIDRTSLYEKLEYRDGEDIRVLSPYCILLCLSSEGKLILFHIARISDPSLPFQTSIELPEDIDTTQETSARPVPLVNDLLSDHSKLSYDKKTSSAHNLGQICGPAVDCGVELKSSDEFHPSSSDKFSFISSSNQQGTFVPLLRNSPRQPSISEKMAMPQFPQTQGTNQAFTFSLSGSNTRSTSSSMSSSLCGVFDSRKPSSDSLLKQNEVSPGLVFSRNTPGASDGSTIPEKHTTDLPSYVSGISTVGGDSLVGKQAIHSTGQISPACFSPGWNSQGTEHTTALSGSTVSVCKDLLGVGKQDVADNRKGHTGVNSNQETPGPFYRVNDMVKELDELLLGIEQGGLAHLSTMYLKSSVSSLEKGLANLSEKFKMCKDTLAEFVGKVQHLHDKMVQISAWEVYMEGIVKQASNCEYWDIWNRQKLGPEFELKQQQILKGNQNLRNQLLELERHFNMLELNKFGESGVHQSRRALHISETSRQIQMLHSLHSTVISQLAAAEHLSDCLSRQMASLNTTSVKRHSIAMELLESIGVEHNFDSFGSPDGRQTGFFPESFKRVPLSPATNVDKRYARRNASSQLKSSEPETARRTRDSLDRNWDSFEPLKATVKRISYVKNLKGADGISSGPKKGSKILTDHKEMQCYHMFESQAGNSVLKWAKDASGSTEVGKSNSLKIPVNDVAWTRDIRLSSLETASPSTISNFPSITPEHSYLNSGSSFERQSPGTSAPLSNDIFNSQTKIFTTSRLPSADSNTISPLKNPSPEKLHVFDKLRKPEKADGKGSVGSSTAVSMRPKEDTPGTLTKSNLSPFGHGTNHVLQVDNPRNTSLPLEVSAPASIAPHVFLQSSSASFSTSSSLSLAATTASTPVPLSLPSLAAIEASATCVLTAPTSTALTPSTKSITVSPSSSSIAVQSPLSAATPPSTSLSPSASVSTASSPSPFVSPIMQVKPSPPVPNIGFDNSLDATKPVNSMVTPTASKTVSSQAPFSSGSSTVSKERVDVVNVVASEEDDMDEEVSETPGVFSLGSIEAFGLGSSSTINPPKANPFGGSFSASTTTSLTSSSFSFSVPSGQIFKPASFSLPSSQPAQSSAPMSTTGVTGGFSGFAQPSQIGVAKQALGSVLGTFGQTRQLGGAQGVGFTSSNAFGSVGFSTPGPTAGGYTSGPGVGGLGGVATGGFVGISSTGGGFAGAARGGGFAALASTSGGVGGGFAALASTSGGVGGGFAALASTSSGVGGGFSALASTGGGVAASSGSGYAGGFGSLSGSGKPPAEFLMQMRK